MGMEASIHETLLLAIEKMYGLHEQIYCQQVFYN